MSPAVVSFWLIAAGMLAGCATPAPVVVTEVREVRIPVIEPCVSTMPAAPELISDRDLASLDDYGAVLALYRDRMQRAAHMTVLEAALTRCATKER